MPLTPLPSNNTAVLYVDYSTGGVDHTLQCRFGVGGSAGDAMAAVDALLIALEDVIAPYTILGARVRDAGLSVTYPVEWTGDPTYGSGAGDNVNTAWYLGFNGRSIGGYRCRVFCFGARYAFDTANKDYRFSVADDASVAAAVAVLDASSDVFVAVDGDPVNWHQYANLGVNAYWRNHLR